MPLITQTASTFSYLTGVPPVPPVPIMFPKDSIVPYYSTTGLVSSDWDTYSLGNGKYIAGTTNSASVGTNVSATNAQIAVSLGSTGAHTGSVAYTSSASATSGSTLNNGTNNSAGAHSHYGTIPFTIQPQRANVVLIKANKEVARLPANTIAFRRSLTGSYGTPFYPNSSSSVAYVMPGTSSGTLTSASSGGIVYSAVGTGGTHRHHSNTNQYYITGKLTNYWGIDSGSHYHDISGSMTQTIMNTTIILDAWISATTRIPQTDVVVMYSGNIANLPSGWFLCDGNNGTINMNGYYLGIGSDSWGTIKAADATMSATTVGSAGSHSHVSNYNPAGAGITLWHGSQAWSHTHTMSRTMTPFVGAKFLLYFIQYKG